MVAAFDYCLHGKGGAAPSIDTAMHGLVDAAHVDHLHPDAGIALATAADGEALTRACFGDRVLWVPWRRPGFQLGLDIAAVKPGQPAGHRRHPRRARDHRLGRDQRRVRGRTRWRSSRPRSGIWTTHGRAEPFGPVVPGYEPLPEAERRARAAALAPVLRGLASTDRPQVGHFTDAPVVLDFLARGKHPALAALGTSCPDHFLRTKVAAAGARPAAVRPAGRGGRPPAASCTPPTVTGYRAYYERHAGRGLAADARRRPGDRAGAGRGHVQLRRGQADRAGGRGVLRQRDQRDARRRVGLHATARSRRARSSGSSTGRWRRPSWRRRPRPRPLAARVALVTGGGSGIGRAIAAAAGRRGRLRGGRRPGRRRRPRRWPSRHRRRPDAASR